MSESVRESLAAILPNGATVAPVVSAAFPSVRGLLGATEEELKGAGVPAGARRKIRAVGSLFRSWAEERIPAGTRFRSGSDIFQHFHARLRDLKREQFWTVLLDGKNRVREEIMISEGSLTASLVHPREVFAPAIRRSAGAVVFVHNHPSGDPTPSVEDVEITRRLSAVAELVGIRVLDHVVVGDGAYVSFLERGLLGAGQ
jgi:DNA repair protein RadC